MFKVSGSEDGGVNVKISTFGAFLLAILINVGLVATLFIGHQLIQRSQQMGNGCSYDYPYLLAESAVEPVYYFQGDKTVKADTGEVIQGAKPEEGKMWIVRLTNQNFLCVKEDFVDRLIEERNGPAQPLI